MLFQKELRQSYFYLFRYIEFRLIFRFDKKEYQSKLILILMWIFIVVNKAWKTLESDETRAKCMDVIEEAKARTDHNVR